MGFGNATGHSLHFGHPPACSPPRSAWHTSVSPSQSPSGKAIAVENLATEETIAEVRPAPDTGTRRDCLIPGAIIGQTRGRDSCRA